MYTFGDISVSKASPCRPDGRTVGRSSQACLLFKKELRAALCAPLVTSSGRKELFLKLTPGGLRRPTDGSPRSTYDVLRLTEATIRPCQMTSHRLLKAAEGLVKPTGVISIGAYIVGGGRGKASANIFFLNLARQVVTYMI